MKKILLLTCLFITSSCIKDEPASLNENKVNGLFALSKNVIENIITPAYTKLSENSVSFNQLITKECTKANLSQFNRSAVKKNFLTLMRSYHYTEAFQVGTIAENGHALREYLYSWPASNTYLVDKEIVRKTNDESYEYDDIPSAKGLPALEYLVYEETLINQCSDCGEEELEAWNKLPEVKKLRARCDYMIHLSEILKNQLNTLAGSWQGDVYNSENYKKNFATVKEFAIKLTHGFNFIDRELKDNRLGIPSGINFDLCGFDSCPEQSEHLLSGDSLNSLYFTLKAFLELISGDTFDANLNVSREGYGYEEWLSSKGHQQVSEELITLTQNMMRNLSRRFRSGANVETLSTGISYNECKLSTSTDRKVEICSLYQDIKKITDLYKNQFLLVVDFGRPADQGGDAD